MNKYQVWTDGACKGNPGPGGAGYLILSPDGNETEFAAHEPHTTNNRMELTAPILALASLPDNATVVLTTDSQYVKNGITQWIHNWRKKKWKNAKGQPVKNQDLWVLLDQQVKRVNVEWEWVKGHSDDYYNDKVDKLASDASYG